MVSKLLLAKKTTFILAPILACPLLFFGKEYKCIYVIVVMCVYWLTEVIPMGITALLPLLLYPFFEIQGAKDASMSYFKDTTILGITSLIMSNAVEEVKLHKRIALGLLKIVGFRKHLLLLGVSSVTAMVSWLIVDMAATAMMLPIVIGILETSQELKKTYSDESSPSSSSDDMGDEEEGTVTTGKSSKSTVTRRTASGKDSNKSGKSETKTETSKKKEVGGLDLKAMSKEDRGFAKALIISTATASLIGGTATITGTMANLIFRDQMSGDGEVVTYLQWMTFSIPFQPLFLAANHLVLTIFFMGPKSLFCCSRKEDKEEKQKINRKTKGSVAEEYAALGKFSFGEASVMAWFSLLLLIWIFRKPGFIKGWSDVLPREGKGISDATVSVFIAILMFFWPKDPRNDPKLTPILNWTIMKTKFSWQCVLLVAAGNSISDGVKMSGLGTLLGCFLRDSLSSLSHFWLMVMAQVSAGIMTEFTSNTSTAGILVPIMLSLGSAFGLNPLYLVIPCTYACSFGFMTPMATPGNAVVFDTGYVTIMDMALSGFVLKILCIMITSLDFETLARLVLHLDDQLKFAGNQELNCTA